LGCSGGSDASPVSESSGMRGAHRLSRGRELGDGGATGTGAGGATGTGAGGAAASIAGRITGAAAGLLDGATVLVGGCASKLPRTTTSSHTSTEPRPATVTIEMLRIAGPNAPAATSICAGEQKARCPGPAPAHAGRPARVAGAPDQSLAALALSLDGRASREVGAEVGSVARATCTFIIRPNK